MRHMRFVLLMGFLALGGCGFSPIYASHDGETGAVATALNNVQIASIPDRQGQMLRNHLIDRMYGKGRPQKPTSLLEISLASAEVDLGIQKDATASRRSLNMWATYVLKDMDGATLTKGTARSIVSYNKLSAQYGTLASQEDAHNRAVREVGEQIVSQVSLFFAEKPAEAP